MLTKTNKNKTLSQNASDFFLQKKESDNLALKQSSSFLVQPKLTIGTPDDIYEKEADAMADKVMQMPEPINFSSGKNSVQRKCEHCEEEEKQLQKKESNRDSTSVAPTIVHDVLNSSTGKSLDDNTRSYMEPRFNYDFSSVKIHDDNKAAESASSINALAYTSGNDVVFNSGQYNTNSDSGKRLLAHELTHVVQQKQDPSIQRSPIKVTLNYSSACTDPKAIAEAIPGALAMANVAMSWFISVNTKDIAKINILLKEIFLSNSESVRDAVFDKIISMKGYLEKAQAGNIYFDCGTAKDPECTDRPAYVLGSEKGIIHICPAFFPQTLEDRKWTLVHESAHLAGVAMKAESYYGNFGTVGCTGSISSSLSDALNTADNYAKFIWCLTRPSGTIINKP